MLRGCIAVAVALSLPLALCGGYRFAAARSKLPADIEWDRIVGYHEEGFFMEGCVFGAYHLTPRGVAATEGWTATPAALMTPAKYAERNRLADGTVLNALAATSCAGADAPPFDHSIDKLLATPGNRFRAWNHGEGMIVVERASGFAWYLYFG